MSLMSSLSSWSLSDLFILLLLAILPTEGKRQGQGGHFSLPPATEAKHMPPCVPYQGPGAGNYTTAQGTRDEPSSSGSGSGRSPHRRLAMRLLFRPIPRHFSRCGAKREAAILRLQLGQTHSLLFHWLKTCPKMSNPGWSTISGDRRGVAIRAGRGPSPLVSRPRPRSLLKPPA